MLGLTGLRSLVGRQRYGLGPKVGWILGGKVMNRAEGRWKGQGNLPGIKKGKSQPQEQQCKKDQTQDCRNEV